MSWHDATKINESAEDSALREELRNMLGLPSAQPSHIDSTPETVALARSLHREALRRRRTSVTVKPLSKRPFFILAAAAIPVFITVSAIGTWGVSQKRKADALAADLAAKEQELESRQNRVDAVREGSRNRETPPILQASDSATDALPAPEGVLGNKDIKDNKGELVRPEEKPSRLSNKPNQHRVNEPR